jgi:RND family efflux transporter MFP subunit
MLVGYVAYDLLGHTHPHAAAGSPRPEATASAEPKQKADTSLSPLTVSLTAEKLKAARIAVEAVRLDRIPTEVGLAGQIQDNPDRQVEIRPRALGIVCQVHVVLGQKVERGDPLISLDSPEVGTARLNLRNTQRALATARFDADWKNEIAANVALLIPELQKALEQRRGAIADDDTHLEAAPREVRKRTDARLIERQFADKQLGAYRGTLLQAYAEFDIASHEEQKTASLRSQGIVGEHPVLVARHTREGIQAKLAAAIEQVRYDAAQEKRLADQRVRQAEAAVIDAAQRLRILGVSQDIPSLLAHPDQANRIAMDEDVTFYGIVAPFDGTIIKKFPVAVPSAKADLNDILFILADLRSVWVTANVSESDLAKLSQIKGGTFRLRTPAYPNREFSAKLLSVGALVDPQTRTVPLRAETDNADGIFKDGMFVRVILDSGAYESVLTAPASAVVEIDEHKLVFVPAAKEPSNRTFLLRSVEIGRQWGDRVAIKAGLNPGDDVVASGAFVLKSERILQNQSTEDE